MPTSPACTTARSACRSVGCRRSTPQPAPSSCMSWRTPSSQARAMERAPAGCTRGSRSASKGSPPPPRREGASRGNSALWIARRPGARPSPTRPRSRSSNTSKSGWDSTLSWRSWTKWPAAPPPIRPSNGSPATRSRSCAGTGARPWSGNTCNNPPRATSYARTGTCPVGLRARDGPGRNRVRMNGDLTHRSTADVLAEVQRRQSSGVLRLHKDALTRQLFIDAGAMIRFAVSTLPSENITALFKEKGGITDVHVHTATTAKQREELLGTTLVRLGFMTRETLSSLTREHIHRVVVGALAMREGTYEFQPGALPFREQLDGGVSTPEILLEWARALPDIDAIRRTFGSPEVRIAMSPRPPKGYQNVKLNPAEGYIMSRVDGRTSVGEICMVSPMGEEITLRALFGLALAGILEMPGSPSAPAAPSQATAAPAARPAVAPGRAPTNGGATAQPPHPRPVARAGL